LSRDVLRRRLLLVLFGLGTNMGIKRVAVTGKHGESEATLRRVRHLFVNRANMRAALVKLVNATFAARDEMWWGTGTACASDSRKFGAWSSNLMTEWHQRYRGPGVMIYWHVERKSVCIYSQLKSCSASEVASMIEGVLRHCTDMEVDRQCTDTHGASIVGFAFAHMLDFKLMPRLKNIGSAKLYRPAAGEDEAWPHLAPVCANKDLFYGKDGDLAGSDKEAQEVSMLALHLLQSALVHVNTLLVQQILADEKWADTLTDADRRALSPLFWTHVNPYGRFELDMHSRLDLELTARAVTVPGPRTPESETAPTSV
jgi:TnpA family transposase